jgi:hypothetical protein
VRQISKHGDFGLPPFYEKYMPALEGNPEGGDLGGATKSPNKQKSSSVSRLSFQRKEPPS